MAPTSDETRMVCLRLICVTPPPSQHENRPTEFGLQDKKQVVHPGQAQADGSVHYEFEVQVKRNEATDAPRFLGPYVHGTPAGPFLYLSWRHTEPEQAPWIRRLKVPLSAITWEQIEIAGRAADSHFETSISGLGSGTVSLLGDGWTLQASRSS